MENKMFDLNMILNAALIAAVEQATKPLLERIVALETYLGETHYALDTRITALENNPAIGVDTTLLARVVALENEESNTLSNSLDNLDGQEWFWEKVSRKAGQAAQAVVEEAMEEHCESYDHDDYDRVSSAVDDLDLEALSNLESTIDNALDDKLEGKLEEKVNEKMDEHLQTYDHDVYDGLSATLEEMGDIDDLVKREELRAEIEDVIGNATFTIKL